MSQAIITTVAFVTVTAIFSMCMFNHNQMANEPVEVREVVRLAFDNWAQKYEKTYIEEEYEQKLRTFNENLQFIVDWNSRDETHKLALNQFADLTNEEFKLFYTSQINYNEEQRQPESASLALITLPDSVDHRTDGSVGKVKNQGSCGSCWAFSTMAAMEGAYFMQSGTLENFAEQQLVDCDKVDQGCNGGLMDNAFTYLKTSKAMLTSEYPYTARRGSCRYQAGKGVVSTTDFHDNEATDMGLMTALSGHVVSVAIQADQTPFQFYNSGVITSKECGTQLDHGVTAVGYGETSDGVQYYIVKNSWGSSWGEDGYVRIGRQVSGQTAKGVCGILQVTSYPVL